jgi:hypothetical protein
MAAAYPDEEERRFSQIATHTPDAGDKPAMPQASPLTAEDRTAIVGLIAAQNHLLDDWDIEGFVSNFVDDGVFETALGHCEGHDEMRRHFERLGARPRTDRGRGRHFVGGSAIEGDADRCTVRTNSFRVRESEHGELSIGGLSEYQDVLVKVKGRWLFKQRHVEDILGKRG